MHAGAADGVAHRLAADDGRAQLARRRQGVVDLVVARVVRPARIGRPVAREAEPLDVRAAEAERLPAEQQVRARRASRTSPRCCVWAPRPNRRRERRPRGGMRSARPARIRASSGTVRFRGRGDWSGRLAAATVAVLAAASIPASGAATGSAGRHLVHRSRRATRLTATAYRLTLSKRNGRSSISSTERAGRISLRRHEPLSLGCARVSRNISYVGGCSFARDSAHRFSYRWSPALGDADARRIAARARLGRRDAPAQADVFRPAAADRESQPVRTRVRSRKALAGDTGRSRRATRRTCCPGVRLAPAFFSRVGKRRPALSVALGVRRLSRARRRRRRTSRSTRSISARPDSPGAARLPPRDGAGAVLGPLVLPRARVRDLDHSRHDLDEPGRSRPHRPDRGAVDPRVPPRQRHRRVPVAGRASSATA